ncbi:MAG: hypothetical protein NE328_10165, partial [Lentisphaeraceae bacterium]|nr:hypothetical protein [Lentisphaeraceae bacterium]
MKKLLTLILCLLFFTSCKSFQSGQGLSAIGALTAGTLAWKMTENKSPAEQLAWTAASSVGAYALGEHIRGKVGESEQKHYQDGYQAGIADTTKMQYEIIQNRQKENRPAQRPRFFLYEFPGVPTRNG